VLSDLRGPGEIEEDADIVMLAPRPETCEPEDHDLRVFAEVLVRKHRSGALGDIPLNFRLRQLQQCTAWRQARSTHQFGVAG
jgi:replicative DNA helicase